MWYAYGKLTSLWVGKDKVDGSYLTTSRKNALAFETEGEATTWVNEVPIRKQWIGIMFVKEKRIKQRKRNGKRK